MLIRVKDIGPVVVEEARDSGDDALTVGAMNEKDC